MIHDIEIILHLVRSEIESIDAVGVPVLTRREDIANARIRFDRTVAWQTSPRAVSAPSGCARSASSRATATCRSTTRRRPANCSARTASRSCAKPVTVEKDEPLKLELEAFVDCATHGYRPRVSGSEAAAALKVAIEITRMIEESVSRAQT